MAHTVNRRLCGVVALAALCLGLHGAPAGAQNWPNRPIRIVVSAGPSTPPDIISRIVTNEMQSAKGWNFIIENKYGAAQTVAGLDVRRAPADGYSVWLMGMVATTAPALMPQVKLDIAADFVPVVELAKSYNVLVVHPDVPAKTLAELVAHARANPGKLNYASGGIGTPAHLIGEIFRTTQNVDVAHVPYGAFPQAIQDLLSNRTQFGFLTTLPMVELIAAGKLRAIAVTAPQRVAIIKDVPTAGEQGFDALVADDWFGAMVVKGTPPDIAVQLNAAFNAALKAPAVRAGLEKLGAIPAGGTAEAFGAHAQKEVARWSALLAGAGIKPKH